MQIAIGAWDGDMSMVRRLSLKLDGDECAITYTDGTVSIISGNNSSSDFKRKLSNVLASTPAPNLESLVAFGRLAFPPMPLHNSDAPSILFDNIVRQTSDGTPATDYLPDIMNIFIIGIDNLTALTVGCSEFTSDVWQSIAYQVDTVERITVSDRAAALGLFSALASDSSEPLFPHLRTISFERMALGDGRSSVDEENHEDTQRSVSCSILDQLVRVMDNGGTVELGIRLVVIAQCDIEAPMVEALQRHLGYHNVQWDGMTNGFYTYSESAKEDD
ncbi:hypothetical protein BV25DRAFT_1919576 [Artomyces pyxidatus]|uniref:Uncharacterized protein n=1 Tax=Artomyces pyxidatus TaxID=48021 RepID=A0ACB8SPU3_9AGAM|nr:hypothetical protein BV25DRAFT_1919576 [Artomyces pyxidatus]